MTRQTVLEEIKVSIAGDSWDHSPSFSPEELQTNLNVCLQRAANDGYMAPFEFKIRYDGDEDQCFIVLFGSRYETDEEETNRLRRETEARRRLDAAERKAAQAAARREEKERRQLLELLEKYPQ